MAHQAGPIRLKGKLGELSFYYNKQYGYLVRQKGGPDPQQVALSDAFQRTRENASEFASAAATGKLLRTAVKSATGLKGDGTVTPRFTGLLMKLAHCDTSAARGSRSAVRVLTEVAVRDSLSNFAFYRSSPFDHVYSGRIQTDLAAGTFSSVEPLSTSDFRAPKAATHVRIRAGIGDFDFDTGNYMLYKSPAYVSDLGETMALFGLNCSIGSVILGSRMGILSIEFLQEQNGVLYPLTEGSSMRLIFG